MAAKKKRTAKKKAAKKRTAKKRPAKRVARKKTVRKKATKKKATKKRAAKKKVAKKKKAKRRANGSAVLMTKALGKAPVALDDAELAELGHALEVELPRQVVKFGRGAVLAWSQKKKALVILEGGKRKRTMITRIPKGAAARSFERWADRAAKKASTVEVAVRGMWRSVGRVRRIDYRSDKWGRTEKEYTHKTGPNVRLYVRGALRPGAPRVWVIKGGRLTVTARGIVN